MMREILVINSGSSSIKFALFGATPGGEPTNLKLRYRGHFAGLGSQARLSLKDGEGEALDPGSAGSALSEVTTDLDHDGALSKLLAWIEAHPDLEDIGAVGHRIVHGGRDHVDPVRLDANALDALEALVPLAPLHQPYGLAPGACPGSAAARPSPGGLLRHGLSCRPAPGGEDLSSAAAVPRRRRHPLRLPWALLRLHQPCSERPDPADTWRRSDGG
ncbi:hypothetical protein Q427_12650 [Halomonas sp. BC04]|nr:hypothetical protein Q427_12650 [Halomonas sp. BC04]